MILDKLYINGRLCQEEIEEGEAGRGGGARGTRSGEDAGQVDGENSISEDNAGDRGVLTQSARYGCAEKPQF